MTAAARLAALDSLPADDLCRMAEVALSALVDVMNQETTLLRAGHMRQAGALTPEKTRLAQDYVSFARAVQRQNAERLDGRRVDQSLSFLSILDFFELFSPERNRIDFDELDSIGPIHVQTLGQLARH